MLRQQTKEEKQLWEALSGGLPIPLVVQPTGTGEEIRRVDHALRREIWNMTWWRYPLAAFMIVSALVLAVANIMEALAGKFSEALPHLLIKIISPLLSGVFLLTYVKPGRRWRNGAFTILELSKHASASESVGSLIYIARLDCSRVSLNLPELYERLAQVLTQLTDFIPDSKEAQFLKQVVLNSKRYPPSLRIAALLILGDYPELLDSRFRAQLEMLRIREQHNAVLAAIRDVLSRE